MIHQAGDLVIHSTFGSGEVILDCQETVIVRFGHGIEECEKRSLDLTASIAKTIAAGQWQSPQPVILRGLAATIASLNNRWSVFSRSRIKLLPHQLWVCRKVLERWPFRWLIADDVGLGKTVEAGLILWPLISRKVVRRVLILTPASLTEQWIMRLRHMFDLRFALYTVEADTSRSSFWEVHNQVVASLQTLREDRHGRHERILNAPEWDLVIVDEAHHLNTDEDSGPTLSFQFLQKLQNHQKIKSMIFFTGTPHRGKDYNFLCLLRLLRPDLFEDTKQPLETYLLVLQDVMLRNNKSSVTDFHGNPLFKGVHTNIFTYHYSEAESLFYETLTQFILNGRTYASSLDGFMCRAVNLVLTALQKLASSSVAAVRSALQNRLEKIRAHRKQLTNLKTLRHQLQHFLAQAENEESLDGNLVADLEHQIAEASFALQLMQNEEKYLEDLVELSQKVIQETRISRILDLLENSFSNRSVLFFTEYKATQSLLMTSLIQCYGESTVTFINGDNQVKGVNGKIYRCPRERAAELFNNGEVRFLVSTEAAGEGIDLQQNCHTLIHVDLPWNPMRLHQRVGRLYRYGQTKTVEVIMLRNPDTIEATIWERLEEKMERIQLAISGVVAEKEDLFSIIMGVTSSSMWNELFSESLSVSREGLSSWFDAKTRQFGGHDALQTVHNLIGHCASFNYSDFSEQLSDIDLPTLIPFFHGMLIYNHRNVRNNENGLSFITPETWRGIGIQDRYENLVFNRELKGKEADVRILGIGHPLMDKALEQARGIKESVAIFPSDALKSLLILFSLSDRITENAGSIRSLVIGVEYSENFRILFDYDLIKTLNSLLLFSISKKLEVLSSPQILPEILDGLISGAKEFVTKNFDILDIPFRVPDVQPLILLYPDVQM